MPQDAVGDKMDKPIPKDIRQPVLLGMGGNVTSEIGQPDATIREALTRLVNARVEVLRVSKSYRTPAFPAGSGPDFTNIAVLCETELGPGELLSVLNRIERELGRRRDTRWGARTIDIDILAIGELVLPDTETFRAWQGLNLREQQASAPDQLIVPHPRLHERPFVLIPLADVAPNWRHPVLGQTVMEMLEALPVNEKEAITPL